MRWRLCSHTNCAFTSRNVRPLPNKLRAISNPSLSKQQTVLLYDGIALDMDGTLTSCVIDFQVRAQGVWKC